MYEAGFIGCGTMGGALAAVAAQSAGGGNVIAADHNPEKLAALQSAWGIIPGTAAEAAAESRFLFLGVKPQAMAALAQEVAGALLLRESRVIAVSMAAGMTVQTVSGLLGGLPVIRIMPNTPAAVGEGVLLYCCGEGVTPAEEAGFLSLMASAGLCVKLEEGKFDAAGAITGCGPAFVYLFVEALTDGGVRCGLPRAKAERFALQTVLGAARLALETEKAPAALRGEVCSPAGSTIEGVAALEAGGVRAAVLEAVTAAYRRTTELGRA